MGEVLIGMLAFVILAALLTHRYGSWGLGMALVLTTFVTFIVLFFTPLGGVIWPDSVKFLVQMGAWRWIIGLGMLYVTIFTTATAVNSEKTTIERIKRGYWLSFHALPWSSMGPFMFLLGAIGVAGDYFNPPAALTAAQIAAPPPGGWEMWAGFAAMAAILIISLSYLLWGRE